MGIKMEMEKGSRKKTEIIAYTEDAVTKKHETETLNFLKLMGTEMVDLTAGPEKKLFRVYRKLLCDKVPYFAKMFGTGFREALEGAADFPEDDAQTFGLLVAWIYFDRLPELFAKSNKTRWLWDPLKLYGLAEKMCITELMDRVMDLLYDWNHTTETFFTISTIGNAYANAADGSTLRLYASHAFKYGLSTGLESWPVEDIQRLMEKHPDLAKDAIPLLRGTNKVTFKIPHSEFKKCDFH